MKRLYLICLIVLTSFYSHAEIISKIEITGDQRVEKDTILSIIDFKTGDDIDSTKLDGALKKLYASGMFADVSIVLKSGILKINCKENPRINKIIIEGNEKIPSDKLLPEISLKERAFFSKDKALTDAAIIKTIYQASGGRYMVTVEPKIIELPNNKVDLIFEVNEGKKTKIKKIVFVGNESYFDNTLKNKITSEESVWYKFFSDSDLYINERADYDRDLLVNFYQSRGYAAVKVLPPVAKFSHDLDGIILTFTIEEGKKYHIGKVTVNGSLKHVNFNELSSNLFTKTGDLFNIKNIERDIDIVTKEINDKGYAFIDVDYEKTFEADKVNIEFNVTQGYRIFVNRINISGNERTSDKVIRRQFLLDEGEPYSRTKLERSIQRLKNLEYFKNVSYENKRTNVEDKINIDTKVEEGSTTSLNFGIGYHTMNKAFGRVGITETNFLGNGQYVDANFTMGKNNSDIDFSFTEPFFMDRNLAVGFDLEKSTQKRSALFFMPFSTSINSFTLRAGYNITERIRHIVRYRYELANNYNPAPSFNVNNNFWSSQQLGKRIKSLVGHSLIYTSTDLEAEPTSGWIMSFDQAVAGLGGNSKFLRHELGARTYYDVYEGNILMLSAKGGHIKSLGQVPLRMEDRFQLGGDSLRGFDYMGIGPRAVINNVGFSTLYPLGGDKFYSMRAELKVPFELQKELGLHAKIFVDAGSVWGLDKVFAARSDVVQINKMRAASGVGLGMRSPFGPISIYYAKPIAKTRIDQTRQFGITFTSEF